jgi:gp16 family phage-associated protein
MPNEKTMRIRSAKEVRADFDKRGITVADFAREHGFKQPGIVYQVLAGKKKGRRGEAHRAAVLLGMKKGVIADVASDGGP